MAFGSAGPVRGTAAALWHPLRAWKATVAPVSIAVDEAQVDRGDSVAFRVEAFGRKVATLWIRAPGESWRPRGVRLDSLGRAVIVAGPLESDLYARVTSGSRGSDTVFVQVRLPVFLGIADRHRALPALPPPGVRAGADERRHAAPPGRDHAGDPRVRRRRRLARALWKSAAGRRPRRPEGRFLRQLRAHDLGWVRAACWRRRAARRSPATLSVCRSASCRDSAPKVEVPLPGADTVAPLSLQVPLVVDVRDDYGITGVAVESRRISRLGTVDSAQRETLAGSRRATRSRDPHLHARSQPPRAAAWRYASATSRLRPTTRPRRQIGRSREYVIRLPTMSEVRAAQRSASEDVGGPTRQRGRGEPAAGASDRGSRAGAAADRGHGPGGRRGALATSRRSGPKASPSRRTSCSGRPRSSSSPSTSCGAAPRPPAWPTARGSGSSRRFASRSIAPSRPELRERLADLQQALKDLDAEAAKDALERLARGAEGAAGGAGAEPRPVPARRTRGGSRQPHPGDPGPRPGAAAVERAGRQGRQRQCRDGGASARRAGRLARRRPARQCPRRWRPSRRSNGSSQAAQQAGERRAADEAGGRSRPSRASGSRHGARASGPRSRWSRWVTSWPKERRQMQQEWREEVVQAIDNALAETGRLAERQLGIEEALRNGSQSNSDGPGGAGRRRGRRAAAAGAGAEDRREERAGSTGDRHRARRGSGADAADPRGDRVGRPESARGRRAGRRAPWTR